MGSDVLDGPVRTQASTLALRVLVLVGPTGVVVHDTHPYSMPANPRDIFRVLAARWLGLAAREGRYFSLATASLSALGYHHDLDEPVIHLWNDAR